MQWKRQTQFTVWETVGCSTRPEAAGYETHETDSGTNLIIQP